MTINMTQPINPMLERVAKAIAYEDCSPTSWKMYQRHARAAVQALMDPTNAMVEVGYRDLLEKGDGGLGDATLCYTAMLKPLLGDEG